MRYSILLLSLHLGCSKPVAPAVDFEVSMLPSAAAAPSVTQQDVTSEVFEPGTVLEFDGVLVPVLQGWSGQTGAAASARVLSLSHLDSGLVMEVWRYPRETVVEPRPQAGCEWTFVDGGAYTNIAQLGAASVGTCVPTVASNPTRQVWMVLMGDSQWHVEARFAPGTLLSARPHAEALLNAISLAESP